MPGMVWLLSDALVGVARLPCGDVVRRVRDAVGAGDEVPVTSSAVPYDAVRASGAVTDVDPRCRRGRPRQAGVRFR